MADDNALLPLRIAVVDWIWAAGEYVGDEIDCIIDIDRIAGIYIAAAVERDRSMTA